MLQPLSRFLRLQAKLLFVMMATLSISQTYAAPSQPPTQNPNMPQRQQVSQRGDFALIGNTLGFDCRSTVPNPVLGNVDRNNCEHPHQNSTLGDSSIDMLFRVDHPTAGQAQADMTVTPQTASSEAVLTLPSGAVVTYARLYWSSTLDNSISSYSTATISRKDATRTQSVFSTNLVADDSSIIPNANASYGFAYQSTALVTNLVQTYGSGSYIISNVPMMSPVDRTENSNYGAWAMVVFYQLPTGPTRQLTLYDGLREVSKERYSSLAISIENFLVPSTAGYDAKLGMIVYEGDNDLTGDQLLFTNTILPNNNVSPFPGDVLSNAKNPASNFFNGTHSFLGAPVSIVGDKPQLTGDLNSMMGLDLDVIDIKAPANSPGSHLLRSGDTKATFKATTSGDTFFFGAFITSISTLAPDFSDMPKTFHNTSGPDDKIKGGDIVEYTIVMQNKGSDRALNTIFTDTIPAKTSYVNNSLCIMTATASTCDPVTSMQGGYDEGNNGITVRLGNGFTETLGGAVDVDSSPITIKFKVLVNPDADGIVSNQATVTCKGEQSAALPPWIFHSGDGVHQNTPTTFPVFICDTNSDCPNEFPFCDTSSSVHFCTNACNTDADCVNVHGPAWICQQQSGPLVPKLCAPTTDLAIYVNGSPVDEENQTLYQIRASNAGTEIAPGAVVHITYPINAIVIELASSPGFVCTMSQPGAIACTSQTSLEPGTKEVARLLVRGATTERQMTLSANIQAVGIKDTKPENDQLSVASALNTYALHGGGLGCHAGPDSGTSFAGILLGLLSLLSIVKLQNSRRRLSSR